VTSCETWNLRDGGVVDGEESPIWKESPHPGLTQESLSESLSELTRTTRRRRIMEKEKDELRATKSEIRMLRERSER